MTTNHLLSTSLFTELFQHNIVSADGRIIANDKELEKYYSFLVKQSKDKIDSLFAERKNMVNDVHKLLKQDIPSKEHTKLLKRLLHELDLKYDEDGLISLTEPKRPKKKYLGPREPKKTLLEREIEEELKRVQILKRDIMILDDWLEQISIVRPMTRQHQPFDPKEAGRRFRQRTGNRMHDMERARAKLIKQHYDDYDQTLKKLLDHKTLTKEEYLRKKHGSVRKAPSEKRKFKPDDSWIKKENAETVKEELDATDDSNIASGKNNFEMDPSVTVKKESSK